MSRNLAPTPCGDVVQRPLAFEPGKCTLYSLPLFVEGPKSGESALCALPRCHPYLVNSEVNDGLRSVLPADECCQSAKARQIGTREDYCYEEMRVSSLRVLL